MNRYLELSIEYANQRAYLDDLFKVYPTIPENIRSIDQDKWNQVEQAFSQQNNKELIHSLLQMELFPIKDSYIAYFRRDPSALKRNPNTINRLAGRIYELGLDKVYERCSTPKETNRQIGPMFKNWIKSGVLGLIPVDIDTFTSSSENAILYASDQSMKNFAQEYLGYEHDKGLDFIARFNNHYVIGETKFLTDFGGHQNAQFNDAIATLQVPKVKAIKIAILDGVLYIPNNNKLYRQLIEKYSQENIMSALLLRDFLYSL